ncbi:MAG: glycosyltransferase [Maricaulaceae bacterium]
MTHYDGSLAAVRREPDAPTPEPMANRPRFAVAAPVGAWSDRLPDVFASLAAQRPRPVVALMDASGDPRVSALADAFPELITVRRHGPDAGQAAAIRDGWARLDADIYAWLNADDWLYPDALRTVASAFESDPNVDVVYGQSVIVGPDGAARGYHPVVGHDLAELTRSCVISQPSCFVRRRALERAGGVDARWHYVMDWELWLRLAESGARFRYLPQVFSAVTWAPGTKTASIEPARMLEIRRILARAGRPIDTLKSLLGVILHHVETYTPFGAHLRTARQSVGLQWNGGPIYGVDASGRLHGQARLPLTHYDARTKSGVRARLGGPDLAGVSLRVMTDGVVGPAIPGGADVFVPAPRGVAAAHVAELHVSAPPGGKVKLTSALLV